MLGRRLLSGDPCAGMEEDHTHSARPSRMQCRVLSNAVEPRYMAGLVGSLSGNEEGNLVRGPIRPQHICFTPYTNANQFAFPSRPTYS